ncbi:molybdenum ABC transporter permease subunit [Spirochaetia bacterium]|nr:molybdenum ABC transporter permease subunit [Spirochaetia bacterium]
MARWSYIAVACLLFFVIGSASSLAARLDWQTIRSVLSEREVRFALGLSVCTSLTSLTLAVCIGIPAAWAIVHGNLPCKGLFNLLLDIPMVTPPLVVGLGLLLLLGQSGIFGRSFISERLFSPAGVIIAQTYVASAIFTRSAISAFMSIDRNYIDAAHNLGLRPGGTLFLVEVPLVWRPLLGGAILAASRAIGEFGATLMLAGATRMKTETLPVAIFLNIATGDLEAAIVCAVLLMGIALFLLLFLHIAQGKDGK